jgi:hypothetical protein
VCDDGSLTAKILGEAGQYPSGEAKSNHRKIIAVGMAAFAVLGAILGLTFGCWLSVEKLPSAMPVFSRFVLVTAAIGTGIYSIKKMDTFERVRRSILERHLRLAA